MNVHKILKCTLNSILYICGLFAIGLVIFVLTDDYNGVDALGDDYYYESNSQCIVHGSLDNCVVPSMVRGRWFEYDDNFIVARQLSSDEKAPIYYANFYWIIDKGTKAVYGPMSLEQYQLRRESLGIVLRLQCE